MKFGFYTLGCKVNQYETQAMEQFLLDRGHTIGNFNEPCDGYIINTCSVTAVADRKNRTVIRRCRRENPDAILGICGCYSQHAPDALWELGADVIGGSGGREAFISDMLEALETRQKHQRVDKALARREFEVLPAGGLEERTRAMLKVQDGCCNFCTYCIIPYTRGPVRSAPVELAVQQAKELSEKGYREIVITGIEIASWGVDLPGKPQLAELGIHSKMRLCGYAHLPLFPPSRHPRGQNARSAGQCHQGSQKPRGHRGGSGNEKRFLPEPARLFPGGSV